MGAYEYFVVESIPPEWRLEYGLALDGSEDKVDSDGDGYSNYQEWVAGTDPTNALSVLRAQIWREAGDVMIYWSPDNTNAQPARLYSIKASDSLGGSFSTLTNGIKAGSSVRLTPQVPMQFYRVGMELGD